jgi:hypothetical protein
MMKVFLNKVVVFDGHADISLLDRLANDMGVDKSEFTIEYSKEELKKQRNQLLKKGTKSQDEKMWFNFDSASMFIQAVSTMEQDETLSWYDANREKVELTFDEAKAYAKEIRLVMQKVYGLVEG